MIEVRNLTKTYDNGFTALKGVSFETSECGFIAITGESGSGKTTLLNMLSRNDSITSGEFIIDGKPISEYKTDKLTQDFAYIYQDFRLIEKFTILENIVIAVELAGLNVNVGEIDALLGNYGLLELKNSKVSALSAGQRQRACLVRALARKPKYILADEPTGNLDSVNGELVFSDLKEIAKEVLVIVVTHNEELSNKYADRIIKLKDGEIIVDEHRTGSNAPESEAVPTRIIKPQYGEIILNKDRIEGIALNSTVVPVQRGKIKLTPKTSLKCALKLFKFNSPKTIITLISIILISVITFVSLNIFQTTPEKMVFNAI